MSLNSGQVKKLLETTKPIKFSQLALSLMYTRLKTMYQKSPTSETVNVCTKQLNDLFAKLGNTLADDYKLATSI
ncbi:MAG: hypothetical protein LBL87_07175 [Ruminococcus sp.]|jgi:hypothetical protein|nr:hypothetical protein [Ruminococcus sp.]